MLERVQELEIELEQVRNKFNEEMKLKEEQHSKLIKEMKEDMGRVIAVSRFRNLDLRGISLQQISYTFDKNSF